MEALQQALIDYGYWGMFLSAILAGSVVPFSSEVVMLGLMAAGLDRWPLIIWATVGNVLGALLTHYMGRLGRIDWIEKYRGNLINLFSVVNCSVDSYRITQKSFCISIGVNLVQ